MTKKEKIIAYSSVGVSAIAATAGVMAACYKLTETVIHPNTIDYHEHYHKEVKEGRLDEEWFHQINKEEFSIESFFGYKLHGFYFPRQAKKTAIIIHGITASLWSSIKYGRIFYERGYNVLVYDQRNHGLSGGDLTSLGVFEKMDGKRMVEYAMELDGRDITIGLHGESMGASTAVMLAGIAPQVDFVIEDCGFTSAFDELKVRLREEYHLPAFPFLYVSNRITKRKYGFDFKAESPIKALKSLKIPVLFLHGGSDDYVPTDMVNELYNTKDDMKRIKVFPGSNHASSYVDHKEEYIQTIYDFLDRFAF